MIASGIATNAAARMAEGSVGPGRKGLPLSRKSSILELIGKLARKRKRREGDNSADRTEELTGVPVTPYDETSATALLGGGNKLGY